MESRALSHEGPEAQGRTVACPGRHSTGRATGTSLDPHEWETWPPLQKSLNCKYLPNDSASLVSFILSNSEEETMINLRDETDMSRSK